jgi:hypothetical protein
MNTKAILLLKNSAIITSRHGNKRLKFVITTGDLFVIVIKLKARDGELLLFNYLALILSQCRVSFAGIIKIWTTFTLSFNEMEILASNEI